MHKQIYKSNQWLIGLHVINTEKVFLQRQTQKNQTKFSRSVPPSPVNDTSSSS